MNRINERALGRSSYSFSLNSTTCSTSSPFPTIPFHSFSFRFSFHFNAMKRELKRKEKRMEGEWVEGKEGRKCSLCLSSHHSYLLFPVIFTFVNEERWKKRMVMEWVFCSFNSSYSSWFSFSISKKWILKERTHDFQEMEMNERVSFLCYF